MGTVKFHHAAELYQRSCETNHCSKQVKDDHVGDFSGSWQEPPRTRLLQSSEDPAEFVM